MLEPTLAVDSKRGSAAWESEGREAGSMEKFQEAAAMTTLKGQEPTLEGQVIKLEPQSFGKV